MSDKRRDDRLDVLWHGYIETEDGTRHACKVRDISEGGVLITCEASLDPESDVFLVIDDLGDFAARIQWSGGRGYGLMLLVGDDIALKKFAEPAGADVSKHPEHVEPF